MDDLVPVPCSVTVFGALSRAASFVVFVARDAEPDDSGVRLTILQDRLMYGVLLKIEKKKGPAMLVRWSELRLVDSSGPATTC